jgi:hypothetical protein
MALRRAGRLDTTAPALQGRRRNLRTTGHRMPELQNNAEKSGVFFGNEIWPSINHLLPRIHHKLTTKKPRSATTISQNPLQKHHSTTPGKK